MGFYYLVLVLLTSYSGAQEVLTMTAVVPPRSEIHKAIDQLRPEQLAQLWEFIELLMAKTDEAPLYRIHEHAVATGIRDLADQHDRYLYGVERRNG